MILGSTHQRSRARSQGALRGGVWLLSWAVALAACEGPSSSAPTIDEVREELLGYVGNVTAADGYRYDATDDFGRGLGASKIIQVEDQGGYAIVYFWWDESYDGWTVSLGTSTNLLDWKWEVDLGTYASQPYIAAASDGGFVVAWEQEPPTQDQSHIRFLYYPTWEDLLAAAPSKTFDAERQLSPCAEGTPNVYWASSTHVDFGFHYFSDCHIDLQARGETNWVTWEAREELLLGRAAAFQGYRGSIGDRDVIDFKGYQFTFLEAQLVLGNWETFRVLLYDEGLGASDPMTRTSAPSDGQWPDPAVPPSTHVFIRTHRLSPAFTNLALSEVTIEGRPAIVVSVFIPSGDVAGEGEAGGLIYYRFLDPSGA